MSEEKRTLRGVLCTTIGGVLWGFSGTCGEYLFSKYDVSPLWLTCLRLMTAGIILILLYIPKHHKQMLTVLRDRRAMIHLTCFGIFGLLMCQFSYLTAISYSNAGTTTVLQNLSLVMIMLITCIRQRKLPNRIQSVAMVMALLGTYILATGGNLNQLVLTPQALFWGVMTAVAVTVYTMLPEKMLEQWGREITTGFGMVLGGIVVNLAARSWRFHIHLPAQGWLAVVAIIILGTVLSFSLFMQGVADVGSVKSCMLAATEPVAATVFSALWLHTSFSSTDFIGFILIIATVFILAKES